ncbi:MAG: DNA polymerase III subunit delta [Clostridiales bacterium]|nr:DNA polymerase III subunit delta [Clostridiales bacterium]
MAGKTASKSSAKSMPRLTGGQFHTEMKRPKAGAYLFFGDENFVKRRELEALRKALCADASLDAFNHYVFTRDNYTSDALVSAILAPPVMVDLKLVELNCYPLNEMRKKEELTGLETALEAAAESPDTLLIVYTTPENFDAGEPKSPSAMMKLISKYAVPVEFTHETSQRLTMWVQKHFAADKIIAEFSECTYLIDTSGHDMTTLAGEIDKLCAYLHFKQRDKLERADIDYICPHNKEIGAFEFADAILDSNNEKAFYILGDMRKRNEEVTVILGGITKIYTDLLALKLCSDAGIVPDDAAKRLGLHPYVAKIRMAKAKDCDRRALEGVIDLCSDTDMALKTTAIEPYVLLERLIVQVSQYRKRKIFQ